jgi:diketogulonate reductase-like aldo/keto reductase
VNAYARTHGATAAQVRIAWSRGPHVLATPGAGNLAHLAENVAAGAFVDQAELVALGLAQPGR